MIAAFMLQKSVSVRIFCWCTCFSVLNWVSVCVLYLSVQWKLLLFLHTNNCTHIYKYSHKSIYLTKQLLWCDPKPFPLKKISLFLIINKWQEGELKGGGQPVPPTKPLLSVFSDYDALPVVLSLQSLLLLLIPLADDVVHGYAAALVVVECLLGQKY